MAYHGIIWGLLSNDVGKAIRHTFVIEPGLEPWRPEANLADKTKATHTRHPMNPGTTMPSASQRWTTFQEPKSSLSPWKHACHRKNLFGIFFFSSWCFPWFANHRFQLASNWEVHWIDDGRRWHWQSCPEMIQLRRGQRQPWTSRAVKDSMYFPVGSQY